MKLKLLLITLLLSGFAFSHKFYVSITDLEYNSEKERIEGSMKLTAHDFEEVLKSHFDRKILIDEVSDTSEVGSFMQQYLASHFRIISDGVAAEPHYMGKEVNLRQELYFYFTFTGVKSPTNIEVMNTVLFGLFPSQQNIVHYRFKERTKSVTLVPSKTHGKIYFE